MLSLQKVKLWLSALTENAVIDYGEIISATEAMTALRTIKSSSISSALGNNSSYCAFALAVQITHEQAENAEMKAWQLYNRLCETNMIGDVEIIDIQLDYDYPLWVRTTKEGYQVFEVSAILYIQQ